MDKSTEEYSQDIKITLEHYGRRYTISGIPRDASGATLQEEFDRLLFMDGYTVDTRCDGGHYEHIYHEDEN